MAKDKKSFVLYSDYQEAFEALDDETAGQLIKHLFKYVNDEHPETDNQLVKLSFIPIKQQLKRDLVKYEDKKKQWSEAGKKSAAKRKELKEQNQRPLTTVENVATESTVNVNDNVNVNVNDIIKRKTQFKKLLEPYLSKYGKEMLNDFRDYWQETSPAGKKMRFEMTKNQPFDPARRLSTWNKKSKNDKPNKINNKTIPTDEQYNEFFNDVNKKEDGKN